MVQVIGLMSGTSVDGIDAVVVEIQDHGPGPIDLAPDRPLTPNDPPQPLSVTLLQGITYPYPPDLRQQILEVCGGMPLSPERWAELDDAIGHTFAAAALEVQDIARHSRGGGKADAIAPTLIGSHGQTVFHRPPQPDRLGYSLQLGRGAIIAQRTGLPTVNDFRSADIAAGGQGAPLVPPIDACLLGHGQEWRCIQNLGGIGNVTILPPRSSLPPTPAPIDPHWHHPPAYTPLPPHLQQPQIRGWDTGPGNSLLDWAVVHLSGGSQTYDRDGAWAAQGQIHSDLVSEWLDQDFFRQAPPKSTGREQFGAAYGEQCWQRALALGLSPADFLATLTELTARSIAESYRAWLPHPPDRVLLCGGGSHNHFLQQRLQHHLQAPLPAHHPPIPVESTSAWGIDADFKEALIFAVLAHWHHQGIPGNLPAVTGAQQPVILGTLHHPPRKINEPTTQPTPP
ncbi:MAG: anhydro-N-acetylmuramic acid kinase [Prochlorothrix sp.]|nr:anhydro-N-acetylmuramic acid kinase [Prochlorothrix sp.]